MKKPRQSDAEIHPTLRQFAARLTAAIERAAAGGPRAAFARRAGLGVSRVNNYCAGTRQPDILALLALCRAARVTPNDLFDVVAGGLTPEEDVLLRVFRALDPDKRAQLAAIARTFLPVGRPPADSLEYGLGEATPKNRLHDAPAAAGAASGHRG